MVASGSFLNLGSHTPLPEVEGGIKWIHLDEAKDHQLVGRLPCPTVGADASFLYSDGEAG